MDNTIQISGLHFTELCDSAVMATSIFVCPYLQPVLLGLLQCVFGCIQADVHHFGLSFQSHG